MTVPEAAGTVSGRRLGGRGDRTAALATLLLVSLGYYLGARLGLSLSLVERNVTPLWPPTGVALVAFLLCGRWVWPAVALAALAVNLPISDGAAAAVATAAGNTAAPLLAATLLRRVGFRRQLDRGRDAVALVFVGALGSMLVSASVGTASLVASGAVEADRLASTWAVWWTGDAMGVLVVAPFLLALPLFREARRWSRRTWAEGVLVLVSVVLVSTAALVADLPMFFLVLPVVGLAAWRLQLRGAAPAALVASLLATWAATADRGVFAGRALAEQMMVLQAFNACVALASFVLAALVTERQHTAEALARSATELEERVALRTADLSAANQRLRDEVRGRSEAERRLVREESRAQREHEIAATLQRSLLPDRLPDLGSVDLAARYLPAAGDVHVGGDWYDVVPLPDGRVAVAIGDVAGHGLQAAAAMGQLRMALRAYALLDPSPIAVVQGLHRLVAELDLTELTTVAYLLVDPSAGRLRLSNAGHPPPLVVGGVAGGSEARFLLDGLAPPLGAASLEHFGECSAALPDGATLLLYTDGLVERRGASISEGLDRLALTAVTHAGLGVDELCDGVLSSLVVPHGNRDDVAVVALRRRRPPG
ncbi:MAG TPA: MASE1 domain-containing protein [Pedococcus sp.]